MKGEPAYITQSLGGTYTVVVNGNMFRIDSKDADALGVEPEVETRPRSSTGAPGRRSSSRKRSGGSCATVTIRRSRSTSWTWD